MPGYPTPPSQRRTAYSRPPFNILAGVRAVETRRIYLVESTSFATLSHDAIRGVEELAKLLWPAALDQRVFPASATQKRAYHTFFTNGG